MKKSADFYLAFWIFAMCIFMVVTYTIPDDGLLSIDNTESTIYNGDWAEKATADENLGLAARKRLHGTVRKPSAMDIPTIGNFNALVQALGTNTDKLGARNLLPDKRAHMNDAFTTITELLKANADTLDTLTGDVKIMKAEINMISDMQKTNVDMMKSEIMTKLDELKLMSEMQKANAEKLDVLTIVSLYSSCLDYRNAGFTKSSEYTIYVPQAKKKLNVYCDQDTDGGGWLVFQRRHDGSVDFYRDWEDYKAGFGETSGEFWLGNDHLHSLTRDQQELRVDLMDFEGKTAYARYSTFTVGSESEKYALTVTGYSGTAGDSLEYHNGMSFSTRDRDNDELPGSSCAQNWKGGWWYRICHYTNLNGIYYDNANNIIMGVNWLHWKKYRESLKKSEMKIRPKQ